MSKSTNYIQAYAVIRIDEFMGTKSHVHEYESEGMLLPAAGPAYITVKEVVLCAEEARKEVMRLNKLNMDKGSKYHWQSTHLFINGGSHGSTTIENS